MTEERPSALPEGHVRGVLSASEAAARAATSARQVRRWIAEQRFPAVRTANGWQIDTEAFSVFVREVRGTDRPRRTSPSEVSALVECLKSEVREARERADRAEQEAGQARADRQKAEELAEWLKQRLEAAERDRELLLLALPAVTPEPEAEKPAPGAWASWWGRFTGRKR